MEQWFDTLTTPRKIEGRFDCGFDGEPFGSELRAELLSRTAHRSGHVEGLAPGDFGLRTSDVGHRMLL